MEQLLQATANNGLAIVLVILGAWFAVSKVWPYVTKRQDRLDEEEKQRLDADTLESKRRHSEYMTVIADFSTAMLAVNVTMSSLAQLVSGMTDRIDDHHAEVMQELRGHK